MATRTITTRIALDGEQEFKQQMASVNSALRTQKSEMQLLEAQFKGQANTMEALAEKDRVLRKGIEQQEEKVKALVQAVADSSAAYGDADKRTDGYRQSLNRAQKELIEMNRELEDTTRYLKEASESADGTAISLDGFGKKLGSAGGDLSGIIGKLGDLKGALLGGAFTAAANEAVDKIFEIVDSTEPYRTAMGTLETSSAAAGYSAEQTAELYGLLQSVIGDTDAAAEASTQLQSLRLSHEDLNLSGYETIGMWVELGRSAPIETIAEAIQQTISAGQATGALSDYLLIAGINEDEFNAKLAAANSTADRAKLVLQELATQGLAQTGQAWIETNQDIVSANQSVENWNATMARLGEILVPVANGLRDLGANTINWLLDRVEDAIDAFQDLWAAMGGDMSTTKGQNMAKSRGYTVDGSHAGGLDRVPYDGYIAQVHKDEAILTASEADWWRSMKAAPSAAPGVTAADLQTVTAAAVNAINLGQGQERIVIEAKWVVNGREFYADTIDDLRAVNCSNPEVTDDR